MIVLLTLLPTLLEALTVMVYTLSSSSPLMVWLLELSVIVALPWSSSGQPTEVFLCHSIRYWVTIEPLEMFHEREMLVVVLETILAVG